MNAAEAKRRYDAAQILDVSCETCGAGEGCRTRSSTRINDFHQARKDLFEQHRSTLRRLAEWEGADLSDYPLTASNKRSSMVVRR